MLRHRDFRLLFLGQESRVLGDRMVVSSYDWFGSYAVVPLGLALWGGLADTIGVQTLLWIASGLFAACVLVLLALPDIWRFRSRETTTTVA